MRFRNLCLFLWSIAFVCYYRSESFRFCASNWWFHDGKCSILLYLSGFQLFNKCAFKQFNCIEIIIFFSVFTLIHIETNFVQFFFCLCSVVAVLWHHLSGSFSIHHLTHFLKFSICDFISFFFQSGPFRFSLWMDDQRFFFSCFIYRIMCIALNVVMMTPNFSNDSLMFTFCCTFFHLGMSWCVIHWTVAFEAKFCCDNNHKAGKKWKKKVRWCSF